MNLAEAVLREQERREAALAEHVRREAQKANEKAAREVAFAESFRAWVKQVYDIELDPEIDVVARESCDNGFFMVVLRLDGGNVKTRHEITQAHLDSGATGVREWLAEYWDALRDQSFATLPQAALYVYKHACTGPFAAAGNSDGADSSEVEG